MDHKPTFATFLGIIFILWLPLLCSASSEAFEKTLSPYFIIPGGDESVDRLPLKKTDVDVHISGFIAEIEIQQTYANEGTSVIEARYCFPLSTRAAVHAMQMQVGERILAARIKEKEEARKIYTEAKETGKTTSLLEQHRPNVFEMNVANILPGDEIVVTVRYVEILIPEDNQYSFIFPTVVGPRYSENPSSTDETSKVWVQNPFLPNGTVIPSQWNLDLTLDAGMPIEEAVCRSHAMEPRFESASKVKLSIHGNQTSVADRDFILDYRLTGKEIQTGLLLHKGEEENFFLYMIQPQERPEKQSIPPRHYVFVVDVSGSMNGFPLDTSKVIMRSLLSSLAPTETFNLLFFAGGSDVLSSHSLPATEENIQRAQYMLEQQRGGGGTRLLPALKRAYGLEAPENASRSIVVLTDGYVDIEYETFSFIREHLGKANLFAFGIGSSVNRFLIEGMAREGRGEAFVVTERSEASSTAKRFVDYIRSPVLTNIDFRIEGMETYDVEPLAFPDLFANRPLLIFGKWRGEARGDIVFSGTNGDGEFENILPIMKGESDDQWQPALRYLWARSRIAALTDYESLGDKPEIRQEVINLGLKYNLATAYTSFVAVDETIRASELDHVTVQHPSAQPKGVGSLAFSQSVATTPEPQTYLLGISILTMILFSWYRFKHAR